MDTSQKCKILLVDDEVDFARLTSEFLESCGYQVDVANSGREGLQKIKQRPDIVLLDRTLGDMEGLEVCRKIRDDHDFSETPVIIVSALDMPKDKSQGLYVGADDYIAKPFDNTELLARIEAVMRRREFYKKEFRTKTELINELSRILEAELIESYYQPIIWTKSKSLLGFEACSRPPGDSILSNPEYLFKIAEQVGRYFELEILSWKKATRHFKKYTAQGKLFLNCNPYFVENEKFQQGTLIQEMEADPHNIVLEITERMAIKDYLVFVNKLLKLKALGFEIAVDDVGRGFAGLETIARLNPNFIKIDMSLTRDIHRDGLRQNIVEAILAFCRKSGIKTIAEGVEKQEELDKMQELGVDAAQGYFLGKPSPQIEDFKRYFK